MSVIWTVTDGRLTAFAVLQKGEPMARYIDADKLIEKAKKMNYQAISIPMLKAEQTADVRPNVRGEWERGVSGGAILMRCNQCKNAISENDFFEICRKVNHGSKLLDFCPNCGSDNRGDQQS